MTGERVRGAPRPLLPAGWPRLSKGVAYGGALTLSSKGKDLLILPLLLSLIGIDGYGQYIQVILIGSMLSIAMNCGMDVAVVRFLHQSPDPRVEAARVFAAVGASGAVVAAAWLLVGGAVSTALELPAQAPLWSVCIGLIESVRSVALGYYRSTKQFERIGTFFIAIDATEVGVLGALAWFAGKASLATVLAIYVGMRLFPAAFSLLDIRPRLLSVSPTEVRERLAFGWPLVPKEFVVWLGHSADRFIVSYFLGPAMTGIYAAAYKVASIVKLVSQPITFVVFPRLAELWEDPAKAGFRVLLKKSVRAYLALGGLVLATFLVLGNPLLRWLSADLSGQGSIVLWVGAGMLFHTVQGISSYYVYIFAGKIAEYTLWISACFGVGLGLQFLLIRGYGLPGAAIGSFVTYFVFWAVITAAAQRIMRSHAHA